MTWVRASFRLDPPKLLPPLAAPPDLSVFCAKGMKVAVAVTVAVTVAGVGAAAEATPTPTVATTAATATTFSFSVPPRASSRSDVEPDALS